MGEESEQGRRHAGVGQGHPPEQLLPVRDLPRCLQLHVHGCGHCLTAVGKAGSQLGARGRIYTCNWLLIIGLFTCQPAFAHPCIYVLIKITIGKSWGMNINTHDAGILIYSHLCTKDTTQQYDNW